MTYQKVVTTVGMSQDGCTILKDNIYSNFLLGLVKENTKEGEVDTEELADNLRYAISEFEKALKAVKRLLD